MNIFFAILFSIFFFLISYPFAKNLQLSGYNIAFQFTHYFDLPQQFGGKNRLMFTKRMIRTIILYIMLLLSINLSIFLLIHQFWIIALCIIFELILTQALFLLCALILLPFENFIKKSYVNKAKNILKIFRGIKIAITGSFGKTSTKNFLYQILKERFSVCTTPKNYNTPMGLCKTAIEFLKDDDEILIVEMGARKRGDIAELMEMLKPNYGIMTAIGEQHLETFKSVEEIKKTKYELCEHMCNGGFIVFDCSNELTCELYDKYHGEKKCCMQRQGFSYLEDLNISSAGSRFKLHLGKKTVEIKTQIIGELILNDFVLASTMAYILGVDEQTIAKVAKKLKPFPHRLQIIETPVSTIIDDSYNSNLNGAEQALKVVSMFNGQKIVITPGFIEQGERQYELNYKFGKMIASVCDELIIMNKVNQTALYMGAKAGGLKEAKIHFAKSRSTQVEILHNILQKGSVVLFENDLPDNIK